MSKLATLTARATMTVLMGLLLISLCAAQTRPPLAARVTRATLAVAPYAGKPCPVTLQFNGTITTRGPAEVKYTWLSSDNSTWPEATVNFTKAGMQSVHTPWELGKTYSGWVQLKVLSPNVVLSPRVMFNLKCGGVSGGPGAGRATRATLAVAPYAGKKCPFTLDFNGTITTSGPAEVKYTWVSFDGGTWPEHTLNFKSAGTEKVAETREVSANQTGWMQLKVLTPNVLVSPRANYRATCPK